MEEEEPKLVRRRANRHSVIKSGRTIGEKREKLETANERMAARQKDKQKKHFRIFFVSFCFLIAAASITTFYFIFLCGGDNSSINIIIKSYEPTVNIEDNNSTDGKITSRMREYIGKAEVDFRDLGYQPIKAVIPVGSIREVDFYLEGKPGFIKMFIDRDSAVSAEDADRMLRYLEGQGINDFSYIDVRTHGKAYWK